EFVKGLLRRGGLSLPTLPDRQTWSWVQRQISRLFRCREDNQRHRRHKSPCGGAAPQGMKIPGNCACFPLSCLGAPASRRRDAGAPSPPIPFSEEERHAQPAPEGAVSLV